MYVTCATATCRQSDTIGNNTIFQVLLWCSYHSQNPHFHPFRGMYTSPSRASTFLSAPQPLQRGLRRGFFAFALAFGFVAFLLARDAVDCCEATATLLDAREFSLPTSSSMSLSASSTTFCFFCSAERARDGITP